MSSEHTDEFIAPRKDSIANAIEPVEFATQATEFVIRFSNERHPTGRIIVELSQRVSLCYAVAHQGDREQTKHRAPERRRRAARRRNDIVHHPRKHRRYISVAGCSPPSNAVRFIVRAGMRTSSLVHTKYAVFGQFVQGYFDRPVRRKRSAELRKSWS